MISMTTMIPRKYPSAALFNRQALHYSSVVHIDGLNYDLADE